MDNKCAPGRNFNEGSCFTIEELIMIATSYNNTHKDTIMIKRNKRYLLRQLNDKLNDKYNCDNQVCWLGTNVVKNLDNDMINFFTFRPNGPRGKYEWLSTSDINKVMKQYEVKYSNFRFFGAVPYDFQELPMLEVHSIDFNDLLSKGIKKIALVINLDEYGKPGSHWVALYIHLTENKIYFFDSFAKKPRKRIRKFITETMAFMYNIKNNTTNKPIEVALKHKKLNYFDIRYNKIQHQFEDSECGVYSMNFIIRLLNGESFDDITNNITKDAEMNGCRKVYFRN